MSSPEATEPVKRRPGRPRKVVAEAAAPADAWKTDAPGPVDERIGQLVDPRAKWIGFGDDDSQYRVENGVIVERVR